MNLQMKRYQDLAGGDASLSAGPSPGAALMGALAAVAMWAVLFVWPLLHADGDSLPAQAKVAAAPAASGAPAEPASMGFGRSP